MEALRDEGLKIGIWQPHSLQKPRFGAVNNGSPDRSPSARQHSASMAQQGGHAPPKQHPPPGASQHRREAPDQPQKPSGQAPQPDEPSMQSAGRWAAGRFSSGIWRFPDY